MTSSSFGLPPHLLLLRGPAANWASEQLRLKWPYLAALGAGCLVGAGGVFLAQRLSRRVALEGGGGGALSRELTSLHGTIRDLREAVRELKEAQQGKQQGATRLKSALRTVTFSDVEESIRERASSSGVCGASSTTTSAEFFSCVSEDEEFFDLPDEEAAEKAEAEPSTESDIILELFRAVDDLMEGGGGEQRKALRMLRAKQDEVR